MAKLPVCGPANLGSSNLSSIFQTVKNIRGTGREIPNYCRCFRPGRDPGLSSQSKDEGESSAIVFDTVSGAA